jgi:hypothetical protein
VHTIKEFVEYFERLKPKSLDRLDLSLAGEKLVAKVDGQELPLRKYSLDARNLESVLRLRVPSVEAELSLWLDGRRIKPNLGSYPILGVRRTEDSVSLAFAAGGKKLEANLWNAVELPTIRAAEIGEMTRISKVDEVGDWTVSFFQFEQRVSDEVTLRLGRSRMGGYASRKGNIGEETCVGILSAQDWRELQRHPFAGGALKSNVPGPDSLMERKGDRGRHLFEFKWQKDLEAAGFDAETGLLGFIERRGGAVRDLDVSGGYIALLDWNYRKTEGSLRTKKVWTG